MHLAGSTLVLCSAVAVAIVQTSSADVVERLRPLTTNVVDDASQTWTETLSADSQPGAYGKTGGGELTFPLGSVLMRNAFAYNLWEGALRLTDDGTSPTVDTTTPPVVMSEAALWLEAGKNYGWKDEAAQTVEYWYDRREASVGGSSYPRAKAAESNSRDADTKGIYYAKAQTAADGKVELNFNGLGNTGSTMLLLAKDNARVTFKPGTLFAVYNKTAAGSLGTLFGADATENTYCFHRGGTAYFHPNNATLQTFCGRFFEDGQLCDPSLASVKSGRHLIEWEQGNSSDSSFNALFNDRGYKGRSGGEGLCELLVFNRPLSASERLAVEEYLMQKWIGKSRAPSYGVTAASGTELVYDQTTAPVYETVKLDGKGTLVKSGAADQTLPFDGSGALMSFDGRVRVAQGTARVESSSIDYAFKGGDNVTAEVDASTSGAYDRLTVTEGAAQAANAVTVAGEASVRVSGAFPSGVETLKFAGRELVLSDVVSPKAEAVPSAPVEVVIPDASFEGLMNGVDFKEWGTGTYGGWTISGGTASAQWTSIFRPQGSGTKSWYSDHAIPPPDGEYSLGITKDASFRTTITLPTDGVYDLTFYTSSRSGYGGGTFEMSLIDAQSVTSVFGRVTCVYCKGWVPRRFSTGFVKAGTYTLLFKGLSATLDCCSHFDDFKMFRASDRIADNAIAIPNGGLNLSGPDAAGTGRGLTFGTANAADGWTLTQTASGADAKNTDVAVTLNGSSYYNAQSSDGGNGMLCFYGDGGTATRTAFTYPVGTLPAGTYRLTAKACLWGVADSSWRLTGRYLDPKFSATLTVNGVEKDLGTSSAFTSHLLTKFAFPATVTLSGNETLSFSVRQSTANSGDNFAAGLIDDFALERVAEVSLSNPNFESDLSGWTLTTFADSSDEYMKNSNGFVRDVASDQWKTIYGSNVVSGCGSKVMFLVQKAQIAQAVTFPSAGSYRLTFWTRARPGYGGNAVHAFLADSNGMLVKDIGTTAPTYRSKFYRQTFVFDVSAAECAASLKLVLKGVNGTGSLIARSGTGGNQKDANVAIDGVSLAEVRRTEPFAIGDAVELKLATGTKLRLDFEGERTVKALKMGGRRLVGRIDASHDSGLVSGTGALIGLPSTKGLVLIVK